MALSAGARLGPYEIQSALGAGGMGEVYKARDTRLDRTVALKVLPPAFASDADFRARFGREARLLSQFSHPNICALYDVGEQQGITFLVMEHLEGQSLAKRLDHGPLSPAEGLQIALAIACGLEAAHRAGVIHRDLKPANVVLTKNTVKLLDFGLAKTVPVDTTSSGDDVAGKPTITTPLTGQSMLLGTISYMAPEQIEGRPADARSDIWAFGCVAYEIFTGTRAFAGSSPASLMANILHVDPPAISERAPVLPAALEHMIRRCLQKDPDERWQTVSDLRRELEWGVTHANAQVAGPGSRTTARRVAAWVIASAVLVALGVAAGMMLRSTPARAAAIKLALLPSDNFAFTPFYSVGTPHFALAPDGSVIAFVASRPGRAPTLWVRPLDSRVARELPGTDDASDPFWSPDSQSLGFFAEGFLKTIGLQSEKPAALTRVADAAGGAWSTEGVIVLGHSTGPLTRIGASGGAATTLARLAGTSQRWPQFLPDGGHFIYTTGAESVFLGAIDSRDTTELLKTNGTGVFAPPGYLLYVPRGSTSLMAQPLDTRSWRPVGTPRKVLDEVRSAPGSGHPPISVSQNGLLAHWDGTTVSMEPAWLNRHGEAIPGMAPPGQLGELRLSPDGRRVAFRPSMRPGAEIWLMDATGALSRFTFTTGGAIGPVWSADGREILFTATANSMTTLFRRAIDGGKEQALFSVPAQSAPVGELWVLDWSRDGRVALLSAFGASTARDIWSFSFDTRTARPLLSTPANEIQARFSPDGRWLAYASDETGRWEIFVQPFPTSGARWQMSVDGGSQPVWRRDGKELLFLAPDSKLMSIVLAPENPVAFEKPQPLFQTRMRPTYPPFPVNYDIASTGERFLINSVRPNTGAAISIVVNWAAVLQESR